MNPLRIVALSLIAALTVGLTGTAVMARPGGWGGSSWGGSSWRGDRSDQPSSREGKVEVSRFRIEGDAALALAHGPISVVHLGEVVDSEARDVDDPRFNATFEAAVEDQLVRSGYDAATVTPQGGQLAEVRVIRSEAEPAEAPHKPVSGEMSVGPAPAGAAGLAW